MSRIISTVCSIWIRGSSPGGEIGRMSIDMLCQDASNNLWPSNKLEIPAFPLHGRSFKKGVRFSVHTTSPGSVPWRRWRRFKSGWSPAGSNDATGRVVRVESTKFREAQKSPDKDCVNVIHFPNALGHRLTSKLRSHMKGRKELTPHYSMHLSKPITQRLFPLLYHHSTVVYPNSLRPIVPS